MSLKLIAPPTVEPVTLAEMKLQCGFGPMEDTDQLREQTLAEQLRTALTAGRQWCEALCCRAFITQTWTLTLDRFPHGNYRYEGHDRHDIPLPLAPLQAITAFTYVDGSGNVQDNMVTGAWGFQLVSSGDTRMARLRPPVYQGWPVTQYATAEAVRITFRCGMGDTAAAIPASIRSAIKLYAQWLFEGADGPVPPSVTALLSEYMILIA